jgi:phosphoglycerate dehydrogenase-like enzyme
MGDNGRCAAPGRSPRVTFVGFVFDPVAEEVIRSAAPPDMVLAFCENVADLPAEVLSETDVLVPVAPVTESMMRTAPRLRFIQKWGTGYEKIDIMAAERHGIVVAITAGVNANTIAEHAIALMLAVMRRIVIADRALRQGRWIPAELRPQLRSLFGKTVGIVGFGNIGRALARQLRGFEAAVFYFDSRGPVPVGEELNATFLPFKDVLRRSDIVSLHCPGGAANRHLIDDDAIAAMKPGAVIINAARGELIVEEALVDALRSGHLSGAGLDVFAEEPLREGSPLRTIDTVVLTPHAAGSVIDDVLPMARHAFENIGRFLAGEPIRLPDVIVDPPRRR